MNKNTPDKSQPYSYGGMKIDPLAMPRRTSADAPSKFGLSSMREPEMGAGEKKRQERMRARDRQIGWR